MPVRMLTVIVDHPELGLLAFNGMDEQLARQTAHFVGVGLGVDAHLAIDWDALANEDCHASHESQEDCPGLPPAGRHAER